MNIINTYPYLLSSYDNGHFDLRKWESYIDSHVPGAKQLCIDDMNEVINAGYSFEKDFLPVLNAVYHDSDSREKVIRFFQIVTEGLDQKIINRFGKTTDTDIILYLGLCNGAGWVTKVNGKTVVLSGIEKIMELKWDDIDSMNGLILHELGHVYQSQYGILHRDFDSLPDHFLWQLFTEGIAMVFEQEILNDPGYYHQDVSGWKDWCDQNADLIRRSFYEDLNKMTKEDQRYFGDWVSFEGHGDTGYYLGARFVRFLLEEDDFDHLIRYGIREVKDGFERFMSAEI